MRSPALPTGYMPASPAIINTMNKRIIHTVVDRIAGLYPDRTAIVDEDAAYTYVQLKAYADRLAGQIILHGKELHAPVMVLLPSGFRLIGAMLAVFRSAQIYLPVDPSFDPRRLQTIFDQVRPAICITSRSLQPLAARLTASQGAHIIIAEDIPALSDNAVTSPEARPESGPEIRPEDPNYIFYTSGSTGEPKAILGCHDSLSHFIHWEIHEFDLDSHCRVSQLSQHTFDASLRDILVPLAVGGVVCVPPAAARTNIPLLVDWLERQQITLIHCVPSVFRMIATELVLRKAAGIRLPRLQYLLMAGEQLFARDILHWRDTGAAHVQLVNLYGTSETTMVKSFHRIDKIPEDPTQAIHAGKPINNTIIAVIRDHSLCRPGEVGEVYIITPFMTLGYYKNEELTRLAFVQNPLVHDREELVYRTGDYGIYLDDGSVEILGRRDDQVKVNGIRVELGEVKRAVLRFAAISDAEVIALKNARDENELVCYYVASRDMDEELRNFLPGEVHPAAIPSAYRRMDEFPLTINGKVDRKMLPKVAAVLIPDDAYFTAVTPTEQKLENIWKELLGLDRVGTAAAFFKIGGASLKLIRMVSMIFHEFNVSVTFADAFANQTIGELARLVDQALQQQQGAITPLPAKEYYELSGAQQRLWAHDRVDSRKNLYNIVQAFELTGPLHPHLLLEALTALTARHEILRTVFVDVDGRPKQVILDNAGKFVYYTEVAFAAKFDNVRDLMRREQEYEFDLTSGPLFRASLCKTAPGTWCLVLSWHHIIFDGWSQDVLLHDLTRLYNGFVSGRDPGLQPLPFQYKDYADWIGRQLQGARLDELELYWTSQFNTPFVPVSIPYSRDNQRHDGTAGDTVTMALDMPAAAGLRACAKDLAVTNFTVLFAAVQVLLNRCTGSGDIVTGSPWSGRNRWGTEGQLGLYVNLLPSRIAVAEQDTFAEIVSQCRECLLGADQHQDYPINMLTELLEQRNGRMLMFNILVQSQNDLDPGFTGLEGIAAREIQLGGITSKAELTFNFQEKDDRIIASIEYDTSLYERTYIVDILDSLFKIVRLITTKPDTRVKDVHLSKKVYEKSRFVPAAGIAAN